MGLDMYLYARTFIGTYFNPEHRPAVEAIAKTIDLPVSAPRFKLAAEAAYWRKANQIHGWFVDNVQGGRDECQESYVSLEQLTELRDLCRAALANKDPSRLPPVEGFFFGGTEIDEYYWGDLEDTVSQLDAILNNPNASKFDYYYRSSW